VPGLGASFGRGGATTYQEDLRHSDCILIMGSNMAEAHPVGFRWPMLARERGGKIIHVDPRFSRTSALADLHVAIRAGTDIAFLGGIINYVIQNERWFKEYVLEYTNAATIIEEGFQDTEDLDGIFSGFDSEIGQYKPSDGHWGYAERNGGGHGEDRRDEAHETGHAEQGKQVPGEEMHTQGLEGGAATHDEPRHESAEARPPQDPTLQHPRCVFQILRRHYARYTPEVVARICGCTPEAMLRVAQLMADNSGRERTSSIVYAVGWTQHTTGVQMIRAAAILQLLLGNVGRPGGGVMAMRGHVSIQGSTDIPTLYDLLPGYLSQPIAAETHETIDGYVEHEGLRSGLWSNYKKFTVSLLKAYYGEAATKENDFCFKWLPRIHGDYSQMAYFDMMARGQVKGYFLFGQNPAAGGPNARLHRAGLRKLDWLVVLDWFEHESSIFWKNDPTGPPSGEVGTEVFFLPAASVAAKEGTYTNTQRLLQWHDRAVDDEGDCHSDLWYIYHLGKRLKRLYEKSTDPKDDPIRHLTWSYDHDGPVKLPNGRLSKHQDEPDAAKVLQEINGYWTRRRDDRTGKRRLLHDYDELTDDGSTACGGWIYSGVFPEYDRNRARDQQTDPDAQVQQKWGFAWPKNVRILYNRASADPQGRPWSERKKLIWWDAEQQKWTGLDQPDFQPEKSPNYVPPPGSQGAEALSGREPFILKPDGRGWLFAPGGVNDGPLPAYYEPVESPVGHRLYRQQVNPTARFFEGPLNPLAHTPTRDYPIVACTFRVTEHYLSGPMSRFNSWLNETMPEMFVELSPELAAEKRIQHGGWMIVRSPRGAIEARAMVTRRIKPLQVEGRVLHQVGIPIHWGFSGETVGGMANDLTSLAMDINVSMHEGKVFAVQVEPGRLRRVPPNPTKQEAHWPTTDPTPLTPPSGQPEGQFKAAKIRQMRST
jgi:formate dehydrogenase major subunit